jgi:plasmid stability protein
MPNLLIRDLDPRVIDRLKAHAKKNNRSMSAEAKHILEQNLPFSWEASIAELERIRQPIGSRRLSSSAPLIREDREHRGDHIARRRSTNRSTSEQRVRK